MTEIESPIRSQQEWERACRESLARAQADRVAASRRAKRRRFWWLLAFVLLVEIAVLVVLASLLTG
jgi:Flp pilus assembly protein TadB